MGSFAERKREKKKKTGERDGRKASSRYFCSEVKTRNRARVSEVEIGSFRREKQRHLLLFILKRHVDRLEKKKIEKNQYVDKRGRRKRGAGEDREK
jgi:hypothetical protein